LRDDLLFVAAQWIVAPSLRGGKDGEEDRGNKSNDRYYTSSSMRVKPDFSFNAPSPVCSKRFYGRRIPRQQVRPQANLLDAMGARTT